MTRAKGKPDEPLEMFSVRLPAALVTAVKHRCVDIRCSLQAAVEEALRAWLRKGGTK